MKNVFKCHVIKIYQITKSTKVLYKILNGTVTLAKVKSEVAITVSLFHLMDYFQ